MGTNGPWKVGELAKLTGITVRALHHYDELGLVCPSGRTDSGHRLYTRHDLARLQDVLALRGLGFSLEQSADALRNPKYSPLTTIRALRVELQKQREHVAQLDDRLAEVERVMAAGEEVSTARLIQVIEDMQMFEKYYTKDQLTELKARAGKLGAQTIDDVTKEWNHLIPAVSAAMAAGTDPKDPSVVTLAKHWMELVSMFTGGDPALAQSAKNLWQSEGKAAAMVGMPGLDMAKLMDYVKRALN